MCDEETDRLLAIALQEGCEVLQDTNHDHALALALSENEDYWPTRTTDHGKISSLLTHGTNHDHALALSLHRDVVAVSEEDPETSKKRRQIEELEMVSSTTGKAWKFVKAVHDWYKGVRTVSTFGHSSSVRPVAVDDMVAMAEKLLEAQERFAKEGKPICVDTGYHYTRSANMSRIQTDGLLSKVEREANNIQSQYNGSRYGDGIYTGTNPNVFSKYGDTGLLVARLRGNSVPGKSSFSNGVDAHIVNRGQRDEVVVLRSSAQCVPLIQFSARFGPGGPNNDTFYQRVLQGLVDEFFNGGGTKENEGVWATLTHNVPLAPRVPPQIIPRTDLNYTTFAITYNAPENLDVNMAVETCCVSPSAKGECPICFFTLKEGQVVRVKTCIHVFHESCLHRALRRTSSCPVCRRPMGKLQGKMPSGTMAVRFSRTLTCAGYAPGSIEIKYSIPAGVQKRYHENPGYRHGSAERTAYLPDNNDGRKLLARLQFAFQHGLTFTVGRSLTTGQSNQVTWSSIHHKTSMTGGPYGFPDANYFDNCNLELDALNVPRE